MSTKQPKHSGFEAPERFEVLPRGTKFKQNPDGTITPILPKQKDKKEPKKKK